MINMLVPKFWLIPVELLMQSWTATAYQWCLNSHKVSLRSTHAWSGSHVVHFEMKMSGTKIRSFVGRVGIVSFDTGKNTSFGYRPDSLSPTWTAEAKIIGRKWGKSSRNWQNWDRLGNMKSLQKSRKQKSQCFDSTSSLLIESIVLVNQDPPSYPPAFKGCMSLL